MKLNSYYPESVSAWAVVNGSINDIPVSGTTFARVSNTVVQVNRTAHGLTNGMWVSFDGLTSSQAYLNGTWLVTNAVANSFQFTVTGSVPTTPTPALIRTVQLLKKFNVAKVGKFNQGVYRVYFEREMDDTSYAVLCNAKLESDGKPAACISSLENVLYCDIQTTDTATKSGADISKLHVAVIGGIN
jgi:uncharacterized membrane protein (GlpM family)